VASTADADGFDQRFSASVAAVTSAFGDPTRREIYLHVRANPDRTASEVATAFSLHPNVARHHLDRLAAGGYLEVSVRPADSAGRPAKRYRVAVPTGRTAAGPTPSDGADAWAVLGRRDDLLVSLLAEAVDRLGPEIAEGLAEHVGERYGRQLAERMHPGDPSRSVRAAMHAIADTLTAHGFAARAEDRGDGTAVVADHCPFGNAPTTTPALCAVDRGLVRGLLAGLCGEQCATSVSVTLSSRARGDDRCAALA
jgi:predicted ArsR family transcriptional regulator